MTCNDNNLINKIFLKGWRPFIWLTVVGFLVYSQTLYFNFTYFDDDLLIINNQYFISDLSNILQSFHEDVFLSFFDVYYRPILTISFIIDAQFSGLSPLGYHLSNILMHLISACLVFILLKKFAYKKELCFLFSLVFAVHPIFPQAVAWIPGRNDPLLALFLLSSFIFFINYIEKQEFRKKLFSFLFHLAFLALALFTKETAVFLPLLVVLYFMVIRKEKLFTKNKLFLYLGWIIIFAPWFLLRSDTLENTLTLNIGKIINSLVTSSPVIIQYIGKIIFPFNLTVLPIIKDTTLIYGIMGIGLITFLLIISKNKRPRYIVFGLGWFILTLAPTMLMAQSIVVPTFLEHRMYLPIIGLFIILLETKIFKNLNKSSTLPAPVLVLEKKKIWFCFLAIIILFSVINIIHSKNFKERLVFWEKAAKDSPHSGFAQNNLGYIYYLDKRTTEAEAKFHEALLLNPRELLAHYHLGNIYLNKNLLERAKQEYIEELIIDPLFDNAFYNLGLVYNKQGDKKNAKLNWLKAIESNPKHSEALNGLGLLYINEGNYAKAAEFLNQAIEYDPEFDGIYQNLGLLYYQLNDFDQAETAWLKSVEINPGLLKSHENLVVLYLQQSNIKKAVYHAQQILNQGGQLQPQMMEVLGSYLENNQNN